MWTVDDADGDADIDALVFKAPGFSVESDFTSINDRDHYGVQWPGGELSVELTGTNAQMNYAVPIPNTKLNNFTVLWEAPDGKATVDLKAGRYVIVVEPADSRLPLSRYVLTINPAD